MVVISCNHNDVVEFYCNKCDFHGEYDITNLLTDNCAVGIDIVCDVCGDSRVLYMLRCKDPAQANELNAKLEVLKIENDD